MYRIARVDTDLFESFGLGGPRGPRFTVHLRGSCRPCWLTWPRSPPWTIVAIRVIRGPCSNASSRVVAVTAVTVGISVMCSAPSR